MNRLHHYVIVRHRHNWNLLLRFGLVGGSGVLVNMVVLIMLQQDRAERAHGGVGPAAHRLQHPLVPRLLDHRVPGREPVELPAQPVVDFKSARHSGWWREYLPFLAVGLLALIANLAILTLLMHPGSPFSLSTSFFDDSTGFRTRLYWAPADRDRDRHPAVVRAEQDLDLLRGPRHEKLPRPRPRNRSHRAVIAARGGRATSAELSWTGPQSPRGDGATRLQPNGIPRRHSTRAGT